MVITNTSFEVFLDSARWTVPFCLAVGYILLWSATCRHASRSESSKAQVPFQEAQAQAQAFWRHWNVSRSMELSSSAHGQNHKNNQSKGKAWETIAMNHVFTHPELLRTADKNRPPLQIKRRGFGAGEDCRAIRGDVFAYCWTVAHARLIPRQKQYFPLDVCHGPFAPFACGGQARTRTVAVQDGRFYTLRRLCRQKLASPSLSL